MNEHYLYTAYFFLELNNSSCATHLYEPFCRIRITQFYKSQSNRAFVKTLFENWIFFLLVYYTLFHTQHEGQRFSAAMCKIHLCSLSSLWRLWPPCLFASTLSNIEDRFVDRFASFTRKLSRQDPTALDICKCSIYKSREIRINLAVS